MLRSNGGAARTPGSPQAPSQGDKFTCVQGQATGPRGSHSSALCSSCGHPPPCRPGPSLSPCAASPLGVGGGTEEASGPGPAVLWLLHAGMEASTRLSQSVSLATAWGSGTTRDCSSPSLRSPTTLCRTLRCYGRRQKPGAWPFSPGRGEHFRLFLVRGNPSGKPRWPSSAAHPYPRYSTDAEGVCHLV